MNLVCTLCSSLIERILTTFIINSRNSLKTLEKACEWSLRFNNRYHDCHHFQNRAKFVIRFSFNSDTTLPAFQVVETEWKETGWMSCCSFCFHPLFKQHKADDAFDYTWATRSLKKHLYFMNVDGLRHPRGKKMLISVVSRRSLRQVARFISNIWKALWFLMCWW